ncbi:hypothetical protein [Actinoallomurus acaciae]|uniref:Uncharacterized protein n=1 Tax=Actinoallomurus acaciae TaxID=502577 RepID=A0ABV5Y7I6_9ACTN
MKVALDAGFGAGDLCFHNLELLLVDLLSFGSACGHRGDGLFEQADVLVGGQQRVDDSLVELLGG